jgi:hypothetical protein
VVGQGRQEGSCGGAIVERPQVVLDEGAHQLMFTRRLDASEARLGDVERSLINSLFGKLQVESRTQALRAARTHNLLAP